MRDGSDEQPSVDERHHEFPACAGIIHAYRKGWVSFLISPRVGMFRRLASSRDSGDHVTRANGVLIDSAQEVLNATAKLWLKATRCHVVTVDDITDCITLMYGR